MRIQTERVFLKKIKEAFLKTLKIHKDASATIIYSSPVLYVTNLCVSNTIKYTWEERKSILDVISLLSFLLMLNRLYVQSQLDCHYPYRTI